MEKAQNLVAPTFAPCYLFTPFLLLPTPILPLSPTIKNVHWRILKSQGSNNLTQLFLNDGSDPMISVQERIVTLVSQLFSPLQTPPPPPLRAPVLFLRVL